MTKEKLFELKRKNIVSMLDSVMTVASEVENFDELLNCIKQLEETLKEDIKVIHHTDDFVWLYNNFIEKS